MERTKPQWKSQLSYIMAAGSAAVGLGNIWRFPYITGTNGGGTFVFFYLLCVIVLGIPLMMGEVLVGRYGRHNPAKSFAFASKKPMRPLWYCAGALGILTGFLILSYYSVISGWLLEYIYLAAAGHFEHITEAQSRGYYQTLMQHPGLMFIFNFCVVIGMVIVVGAGVKKGLERAVVFIFPVFVMLLLLLLFYAGHTGQFSHALAYLFKPSLQHVSGKTVLVALGQAFFSLGIALGVVAMYGAYLPENISITRTSVIICLLDTTIALCAGMIIFPIVFAQGISPAAGAGLIFEALPLSFSHMPSGTFFATLFFVMLGFAAFTSCLGFLEAPVVWLKETLHIKKMHAAIICGVVILFLSTGTILSFNIWAQEKWFGKNFFEALDFVTSSILLPISGFLLALLVGWFMTKSLIAHELKFSSKTLKFRTWYWLIRILAPLAILFIFLRGLEII
ncbi:MAG: sodium-dependent transporter [Gammaproteobacteria bacterium]